MFTLPQTIINAFLTVIDGSLTVIFIVQLSISTFGIQPFAANYWMPITATTKELVMVLEASLMTGFLSSQQVVIITITIEQVM